MLRWFSDEMRLNWHAIAYTKCYLEMLSKNRTVTKRPQPTVTKTDCRKGGGINSRYITVDVVNKCSPF